MSNNSIIEHRGNYHFVPLREEFLILCQNCAYKKPDTVKSKNKATPYCKAFILAILESWTNDKRGDGSLAVFMTYRQWGDSMYGMFGRNAIIDSLDELVGELLVAREPYKMHGKDTFQYFLNYREVNQRIKALPEKDPHKKLPQGFYDPFAEKPDETTRLQVNATDLLINATDLQVNSDPFTSNHNIDTTQNQHKIGIEERGEQPKQTLKEITRAPESPVKSEAIELWDGWMNIVWGSDNKKKALPSRDDLIDATVLVKRGATEDDLRKVRDTLWGQDDFWKKRPITLKVIIKNFNLAAPTQPTTKTTIKPEQQEKKPTSIITTEEQTKRDAIRQKLGKIAEGALNV